MNMSEEAMRWFSDQFTRVYDRVEAARSEVHEVRSDLTETRIELAAARVDRKWIQARIARLEEQIATIKHRGRKSPLTWLAHVPWGMAGTIVTLITATIALLFGHMTLPEWQAAVTTKAH